MSRYKDQPKNPRRRDQMASNTKVHSASKSQFDTFGVSNGIFGVSNGTLKVPNCHHVSFGPTAFR